MRHSRTTTHPTAGSPSDSKQPPKLRTAREPRWLTARIPE
jgi:hypothetical protein